MIRIHQYGPATDEEVIRWRERAIPAKVTVQGRYCRLKTLESAKHGECLFLAYGRAQDGHLWTSPSQQSCASLDPYQEDLSKAALSSDFLHFTVIDHVTQHAVGTVVLIRVDAINGVIGVGHILIHLVAEPLRQQRLSVYPWSMYSIPWSIAAMSGSAIV